MLFHFSHMFFFKDHFISLSHGLGVGGKGRGKNKLSFTSKVQREEWEGEKLGWWGNG
jgi:hypothetical protein